MQSTLNFVLSRKFFKMAAKSYQQRQQMIDSATDTTTGSVAWDGTNGLDNILSSLNEAIKNNGNLYYSDATALANAGFIDGGYAVITNSSLLAFYKWFGVVDPALPDCITSLAGGQWRPVFAVTTPVEGPWEVNGDNEIVPKTAYLKKGVGIGQITVANDLWLDIIGIDADNVARGIKLPTLSTTQMNSMTTPTEWMVINNFTSGMALMQHNTVGLVGFKSLGVLSLLVQNLAVAGTSVAVTLPYSQFVTNFKVMMTPLDTFTASAFKAGYWVSGKIATGFTLNFQASQTGQLNFDLQISH